MGNNPSVDVKHLVKDHSSQNIPLTFEEAFSLGVYMLQGCHGDSLAQVQSVAVLTALHNKATYLWRWNKKQEKIHGHRLPKSSAEQIAGICAAVFEHDIAVSEFGFLNPQVGFAINNCGMGGDLIITANVSTIAAFIASVAGIPMCKHGSPANADKGRHGSSDFISLCGINGFADKGLVERSVELFCFGYTEALDTRYKRIHLQTHDFAKLPHMNDIIGPITNPLNPRILKKVALGINHLIPPRIVAEAYQILNQRGFTYLEHGLFIRGFGDNNSQSIVDELSICGGGTQIAELKDGVISEYWVHAEDFDLEPIPVEAISPTNGTSKGDFSMAILKRESTGHASQMVTANAALLFYLAGNHDLKDCYQQAASILASGQILDRVNEIRKMLPKK
jgi:anthranilate phosphoribosyltransferase